MRGDVIVVIHLYIERLEQLHSVQIKNYCFESCLDYDTILRVPSDMEYGISFEEGRLF